MHVKCARATYFCYDCSSSASGGLTIFEINIYTSLARTCRMRPCAAVSHMGTAWPTPVVVSTCQALCFAEMRIACLKSGQRRCGRLYPLPWDQSSHLKVTSVCRQPCLSPLRAGQQHAPELIHHILGCVKLCKIAARPDAWQACGTTPVKGPANTTQARVKSKRLDGAYSA